MCAGVKLELEGSGLAEHRTAACILTPGLYQMTVHSYEAVVAGQAQPQSLCISVHPLYITVS